MGFERIPEFNASIAPIGEDVPQPRKAKAHRFEHIDRPVTVLNISGVDEDKNQKSAGIGEDVALAAPDFLARVITPNPATLGGFYTLAVDHTG
jgi:hypothetical protein